MASDLVKHLGTVTDLYGIPVAVGVDHDAVTLGDYVLGPEVRDDFFRLAFQTDTEAKAYAGAEAREAAEEAARAAMPGVSDGG